MLAKGAMMRGFLDEVAEQPEALLRTLDAVRPALDGVTRRAAEIQDNRIRRVVFTGMGASYHAVYPALIYLTERGVDARLIETAELLYYYRSLVDAGTLLVCVSQSGRSVEIQRILDELNGTVPVIGITNDLESPLALQSENTLFLNAGEERTVSTKTYTSTLAALYMLACALTGTAPDNAAEQIASAAGEIAHLLPRWREQVEATVQTLDNVHFHSFLGRGVSLASAMTGALIVKESAKVPTEGMSCAQFRHGPIEVVDDRMAAFVFAGPARTRKVNLRLADEIAALGGHVAVIGDMQQPPSNMARIDMPPEASMWVLPILEIVPVQLLAAQLAARRGLEVGAFRYIEKVTAKE